MMTRMKIETSIVLITMMMMMIMHQTKETKDDIW